MGVRRRIVTAITFACIGLGWVHGNGPTPPETKSESNAIVISGVVCYPRDVETTKRLAAAGIEDRRGVTVYVANVPKEVKWEIPKAPVVLKCGSGKIDPEYTCVQVRQQLLVTWEKGEMYFIGVHTLSNTHLKLPKAGLWDRTKYSATFYRSEEGVILDATSSPETAYVTVVPNPFHAVTQSDGRFRLPHGLPPGKYTVSAFHPKLGSAAKEVRLDAETSGCHIEIELGARTKELPLDPYERFDRD